MHRHQAGQYFVAEFRPGPPGVLLQALRLWPCKAHGRGRDGAHGHPQGLGRRRDGHAPGTRRVGIGVGMGMGMGDGDGGMGGWGGDGDGHEMHP